MKVTTVETPILDFRAAVNSVDPDKRTVDLIFSTGAPVDRIDWTSGQRYREVLSMDPSHVRLDRLNSGAPLLDNHMAYSVRNMLGAVVDKSARIEKGQGLATVRFSKRDDADAIFNDVKDGIITNVSIFYRTYKYVEEKTPGGLATRTAVDWEPVEISMVPLPADIGARVRSGDKTHSNACEIVAGISDADRERVFRLLRLRH